MQISTAKASDLDSIIDLLNNYNLVTQDIDLNKQKFIKTTQADECVGIGAMEFHQAFGLLRSVAVSPDKTKQGIASQIIAKLEQLGKLENIKEIYLLTETAQTYFDKFGYKTINRETTPKLIKQTSQFNSLCPASAVVMVKTLTPLT